MHDDPRRVIQVECDDNQKAEVGQRRIAVEGVGLSVRVEQKQVEVEGSLDELEEEVERTAVPVEASGGREGHVGGEKWGYVVAVKEVEGIEEGEGADDGY